LSRLPIGIVDYGIGNHASVLTTLRELGFRCRVSADAAELSDCGMLILPGVGAFRPAMKALRERGLDRFLADWAVRGRPLLGICLGMQLLAQSSDEGGQTSGLGLIPGTVTSLGKQWHIGWNTIDRVNRAIDDELFSASYGHAFYFNHSYMYVGPEEFQVSSTALKGNVFTSAVRRSLVVGVQFHPEKSQMAGHALLCRLVEGMSGA
jgi:glutamine amidotransferase